MTTPSAVFLVMLSHPDGQVAMQPVAAGTPEDAVTAVAQELIARKQGDTGIVCTFNREQVETMLRLFGQPA